MAYSVKGNAIINDSRALLGVSTAGINTALYVGEEILADGASGILTAKGMVVKDGNLNVIDGGDIIVAAGGSIVAENIFIEVDGENVGVATIAPGGALEVTSIDATDYVRVGAGLTLEGSLSFSAGDADEFVTGITTDLSESAGANELVTAAGVEAYVTASVGDAGTLDFVDDNGVLGQVNIGAGGTLGLIGTDNEIETAVTVGLGTQLQISLSDELIIPGTVAVTGLATFSGNVELATGIGISFADDAEGVLINSVGVSSELTTDPGSESRVVSEKAIKEFVDGVQSTVEANANLRIEDGFGGIGTIALGSENLLFNGVANETLVEVSGIPGELTVGLATDVTISGDLIVTNDFSFNGGQLVNVIGIETSLVDTTAGIATNTSIPTQQAVKEYVDASVGGNTNAETITLADSGDVNAPYYIPFASSATGDEALVTDESQLTYNPSTGLLVAQDFNSLSDIRFKENVETITDATAKLEQIRGVEFDWKNTGGSSVGVIAQEIQALYPQLVTEGEEKLTVNYNGLTGLLIQAVKELTARVEELEGKA